jgi:formylmethanofuran dehydrogenase subunit E
MNCEDKKRCRLTFPENAHCYDLIDKYDKLFKEDAYKYTVSIGKGWFKLVDEALSQISQLDLPKDFKIEQIKEKFALLRIYTLYSTKDISDIINTAEEKSAVTCEECGSNDGVKIRSGGWLRTLCETCYNKRG